MDSERLRDERAGEEAADPQRLLPGEDPASPYPDDAQKWVEVYDELLRFKNRLLDVAEETLSDMHDEPARREVVETDRIVLRAEVDRFHKRLSYWQHRLAELQGGRG
ncbi:MAG: hypothetical protein M3Z97_04290 [Candidatus Dormibacteraeota bacterium]|nr:hypothetical protein [Candidatus Dormibacteraeota bacterium]